MWVWGLGGSQPWHLPLLGSPCGPGVPLSPWEPLAPLNVGKGPRAERLPCPGTQETQRVSEGHPDAQGTDEQAPQGPRPTPEPWRAPEHYFRNDLFCRLSHW